jgi:L-lactate utilization protein LutB
MEDRINKTMDNLKKHNINCFFVESEKEAREKVLSMIPPGSSVGLGGSMTVFSIKVVPELEKRNKVYNPYTPKGRVDKTKNQAELRKKGLLADYFLTGTNSLTEDGYLVNTDGTGNRIAAMAYGPKKIILVTGQNKIVKDIDEAFDRIKKVAAPMNAKRHGWEDIPCYSSECTDCISGHRQCNSSLIIHNSRDPERITVILVNKDLGF